MLTVTLPTFAQESPSLSLLGTYSSGIFDESATEIVVYDSTTKRLFTTNSNDITIDAVDVSDPSSPALAFSIDLSPFGANPNSISIADTVLAVAIAADSADSAGVVLFASVNGNIISEVAVGFLPDALAFTNDGTKVVVANEGQPNESVTVDPEGSISIIDVSGGFVNPSVVTLGFTAFNSRKAELENRGIRFVVPGSTVAQDLEPEYVTITEDDAFAYVSLQENNAIAVVALTDSPMAIVDILPLGVKDHSLGQPNLEEFFLNELVDLPPLGLPAFSGADTVFLGGFSGLFYDETESDDTNLVFYTIPDRGPNDGPVDNDLVGTSRNLRPYKLPDYQGRIVRFTLNTVSGEITLDENEQIFLTAQDSLTPITGRGNIPGFDEIPVSQVDDTTTADFVAEGIGYVQLDFDPLGGDFEGIVRDGNGNFWMCDENRPAIYAFDSNGVLIERYVPEGASQLGDSVVAVGTYGAETLPAVYNNRRANRGFEAIALDTDSGILYAFIQSPMDNPGRNNTDIIRILGIDPADGTPVSEYVYFLEANRESNININRVDKIGDAVYTGGGKFLILERDSSIPGQNTGKKFVFEFTLEGATNILGTDISNETGAADDLTLEQLTSDSIVALGIRPVNKRKIVNLPSIGYLPSDKPEGLVYIPSLGAIGVINDNDFGLAGAGVTDDISLGIITFDDNNAFDASNEDGGINFQNWPVFGMYQPDAIATYQIGSTNYILMANEGDAKDYDGFSEEIRGDDLVLDSVAFPNAAALQEDSLLGRLRTTSVSGDIDGDSLNEVFFSYGARSFSILDEVGNLIWDSGDDFEQITAEFLPEQFNSTNDDNDSFDNRSDDKGPEPEAIEIGQINGRFYAFIGLERVGGIMVYDITDPTAPAFIEYINNRNFDVAADSSLAGDLGPEDIFFIEGEGSPTGSPMIAVASEVSGTLSLFGIDIEVLACEDTVDTEPQDDPALTVNLLGTYASGIFDESAAEIVVYDSASQRLFVTNSNDNTVDILDGSDPLNPALISQIQLDSLGGGPNSVATYDGIVAVAIENDSAQLDGVVAFYNTDGVLITSVTVGPLPDMLTFTPDGTKVLVANEGEPDDDYVVDPEGSVSIIDVSAGIDSLTDNITVTTAGFNAFNDADLDESVRIFGPNATVAQDLEPEFIAVSPDGSTAYITLQENNALGVLDLQTNTITAIVGLGFKDHSIACNGIDASNESSTINIRPWPVKGMYQPDAIAAYEVDGATYILSANEGDARDYDGFSEEERIGGLLLDPVAFPDAEYLQRDSVLGRLNSTTVNGDEDGDGFTESLFAYGSRSFSIWDASGNLVWDSGEDFEQITAARLPDVFNSSNDETEFKDRSDDKGPEPEAITVGELDGRFYAFIGLERIGGIMIYDVTDPQAPEFVDYVNNRNFDADPETAAAGDLGPEAIFFIPADDSPNGSPLLAVSNEVSGTTSIFELATGATVSNLPSLGEDPGRLSVYPNPFAQQAQVSISLPFTDHVDISMFTLDGRHIRRIYEGSVLADQTTELTIEAEEPAGMYLLRMVSEINGVYYAKIVLSN